MGHPVVSGFRGWGVCPHRLAVPVREDPALDLPSQLPTKDTVVQHIVETAPSRDSGLIDVMAPAPVAVRAPAPVDVTSTGSFEVVPRPASLRRLGATLAEPVTAVGAAVAMLALSRSIDVDPLDRIGQVSGLAALQLRFLVLAVPLVLGVAAAGRWARDWYPMAVRVACAGFAGLLGGLIGGGLVVALRGTHWGLWADGGDVGLLATWADGVLHGDASPSHYPPLVVWAIALVAKLGDMPTAYANKYVEIIGVAGIAPLAYLCWRTLLTPVVALTVGVTAALPLMQPYKPYEYLVLVAVVPAFVQLIRALRSCGRYSIPLVAMVGAVAGIVFGVLFLGYSGWFLWSGPGMLVAVLMAFPWRRQLWTRGLTLLATAAASFLAIAGFHLVGLVRAVGTIKDGFFYFDVYVDPTYLAMWRESLPGPEGEVWPPVGELGGVGLFTIVLAVGLAAAVALGGRRSVVVTLVALAGGAWLLRFLLAGRMYQTQTVQLYPRTTAEILYCLLMLTGLAVAFAMQRRGGGGPAPVAGAVAAGPGSGSEVVATTGVLPRLPSTGPSRAPAPPPVMIVVGILTALVLLFGSAGSATADRIMPVDDNSIGVLAWAAQLKQQLNGVCPRYSRPAQPGDVVREWPRGWIMCVPLTATPAGGPDGR